MQREKDHSVLLMKAERLIAVSSLYFLFYIFLFSYWMIFFNNLAVLSGKACYLINLSLSLCLSCSLFLLSPAGSLALFFLK